MDNLESEHFRNHMEALQRQFERSLQGQLSDRTIRRHATVVSALIDYLCCDCGVCSFPAIRPWSQSVVRQPEKLQLQYPGLLSLQATAATCFLNSASDRPEPPVKGSQQSLRMGCQANPVSVLRTVSF